MDLLPGRATAEATSAHLAAAGLPAGALAGLSVSHVGIGTYLGKDDDSDDARYREALSRALALGLNHLDTASSYRGGRSEAVLGASLAAAFASGALRREQVVVASKVGYLPFSRGEAPGARFLASGALRPEDIAGGTHAMAPRFIDAVLDDSRARLGLGTLDLYYLHNPESGRGDLARPDWLARIRGAFEALERAASDGRIGVYGVASWHGFRVPAADPRHHPLFDLVQMARDIAGHGHHLRVVQLPFNLAMIEARSYENEARPDGRRVPLLDAAAELGISVVTSAAVLQGQLTRGLGRDLRAALDEATPRGPGDTQPFDDAERAIQFARSTPGVASALVGCKQVAHVESAARVARCARLREGTVDALIAPFAT